MIQQVPDADRTVEGSAAPPPLPTPGTGGREEIPSRSSGHRGGGCGPSTGGVAGSRARLVRYAGVMALLFAVWALSGGGHVWPVWVAFGWGWCLLPDVSRVVADRSGTGRCGPVRE